LSTSISGCSFNKHTNLFLEFEDKHQNNQIDHE